MPASSARSIGSLNASRSTSATAIPSALPAIAASKASTISGMSDVSEPVHWNDVPSSAEASSAPYWVGTKNGFVVTWLTNTNSHAGVSGKLPWAPPPPPPPPVPPFPPASSSSSSPPQFTSNPAAAVMPIARSMSRRERPIREPGIRPLLSPYYANHVMISQSPP